MAKPLIVDGRNLLDPESRARARASPTRASAVRRRPTDVLPETPAPRPQPETLSAGLEAIILAGGKAERLGDAAGGRPKALVEVAGRPLAAYQVAPARARRRDARDLRRARPAGARCSSQSSPASARRSSRPRSRSGSAAAAGSSSRRRYAQDSGDVFALNGDELLDVDFAGAARRAPAGGRARDDRGRAAEVAVRCRGRRRPRTSSEASRRRGASRTGSTAAIRAHRRRRSRAFPTRRPRVDRLPRARGGRAPARVPPRRASG